MKKNIAFVVLTLFCVIILSSCGFKEKTALKIISPTEGVRLTGETPATNVTALIETNRTDISTIPVKVFINDTVQGDQILNINTETTFQIPLVNTGVYHLRLEVDQSDGKKITAETKFVWIPVRGFDVAALSIAQMVNREDPTTGYFIIGAFVLLVMIILALIKSKQGGMPTVIISISSFITLIILLTAGVDPVLAYRYFNTVIGTVMGLGLVSIFAYVISNFANKNYAYRGSNTVVVSAKAWWPTGEPLANIEMTANEGSYFGNANSIPQTQITAIASTLFVLPKIIEQAARLMEECPNPAARSQVIDALYTGQDNSDMHYFTDQMAAGYMLPDGTRPNNSIVTIQGSKSSKKTNWR